MKRISLCLIFSIIIIFSATAEKRTSEYFVKIKTTEGTIIIKLYNQTPIHRDNFVKLAKSEYFNSILFHRIINQFVVQAGDPDSRSHEPGKLYGDGGPGYDLPAEIIPGIFHKKGVLGAARESDKDNPTRKSSASQFYIVTGKVCTEQDLDEAEIKVNTRNSANSITFEYKISPERRDVYKSVGGTPRLDTQYTIFGEVVKGMYIVEKMSTVETDKNDRPVIDIWIKSTKVFKKRS
jgi:cyclophilin family peptidyl-prolyl cis-trans isomerase